MKKINQILAVAALTLGLGCSASAANIVVNGGFESGDFTGWTQLGNVGFTGVACPGPGPTVAEGNCSAFLGTVGSDGTLSQGFSNLQVGRNYVLSFGYLADGGVPSNFSASFGGVQLLSAINPSASSAYRNFNFLLNATAANETLSFTFRDDPGFLFLDAVSLSVPEPTSLALLGVGLVGLFFSRRRKAA